MCTERPQYQIPHAYRSFDSQAPSCKTMSIFSHDVVLHGLDGDVERAVAIRVGEEVQTDALRQI
eukprot:4586778-Lingulodinium_polyedra.AAC.1